MKWAPLLALGFCPLKIHMSYVVLLWKSATLACSKQHYLTHTHYDWEWNIHCCWKLLTVCCYQPLLAHSYNYIDLHVGRKPHMLLYWSADTRWPHTTMLPQNMFTLFTQWNIVCEIDYTCSSFLKLCQSSGTCSCNNSDQPYRLK